MSVNGVTSAMAAYNYQSTAKTTQSKKNEATEVTEASAKTKAGSEAGAVYEPGQSPTKGAGIYDKDAIANTLKLDAESRAKALTDMVNNILQQQAGKGNLKSVFESLTVDAETVAQAKENISENGYWGVSQTSDRIINLAVSLAGNDPDKLEEMRAAFQKGFDMATKAWGDTLPDISQQTYKAVMDKFDKLVADSNGTVAE